MDRQSITQNITILIVALILFFCLQNGIRTGKDAAQAKLVLRNANELSRGLAYFHDNEDRYPSKSEFGDKGIMLRYFDQFPPQGLENSACVHTYYYEDVELLHYALQFCIPRSLDGFKKGDNKIEQ